MQSQDDKKIHNKLLSRRPSEKKSISLKKSKAAAPEKKKSQGGMLKKKNLINKPNVLIKHSTYVLIHYFQTFLYKYLNFFLENKKADSFFEGVEN